MSGVVTHIEVTQHTHSLSYTERYRMLLKEILLDVNVQSDPAVVGGCGVLSGKLMSLQVTSIRKFLSCTG